MLRNLWYRISFRVSIPHPTRYISGPIRERITVIRMLSAIAIGCVLLLSAISVLSQVPPIDAAVKLADVVENKSVTWLVALAAIVAMGVNAYMVKMFVALVRDSTLAFAEVRKELAILKSLVRKNRDDDDTPAR